MADYRYLNSAITLKPTGIIDKGSVGQDNLISIERIIGAVNQANTIDASSATGTTTIDVNLAGQSVAVNIPFIGLRSFAVENFVNAIGANNNDVFTGSSSNNLLRGLGGNDTFNATAGNDTIDGGDGFDIVKYGSLGRAITIRPAGVIDKGFGEQDSLIGIEHIEGAIGQTNAIDSSGTTGITSINVNLNNRSLTVNNIPFIGNRSFTVTNFINATGTNNADSFTGSAGNNILRGLDGNDFFHATNGNDTIDGGNGSDIADYRYLNSAITLKPTGIIDKGAAGQDTLVSIERIIGSVNQANTIDASSATGTATLNVNLSGQSAAVNIPFIGLRSFTVENFVNAIGTNNNDVFTGSSGNNILRGLGGNDIFHSTTGNDTLDGGTGFDVADYRYMTNAITLKPTGIVDKGVAGQDNLISIERIIGAINQANTIDASSATGTTTLDVNLGSQSVTVNIPFIGLRSFAVENFINATGANNNDILTGSSGNNLLRGLGGNDNFNATIGNDTIDGGDGFDSINYGALGRAITIRPTGVIDKGFGSQDILANVEQIVGAFGQANAIDASGTAGITSLDVQLSNNQLRVADIPGLGSRTFNVLNFTTITGTQNSDSLDGDSAANIFNGGGGNDGLYGRFGNDTLIGGSGNDFISGDDGNDRLIGTDALARGRGEIDSLFGGSGNDRIVLGDRFGSYYKGSSAGDFATIGDFIAGDLIELGLNESYRITTRGSSSFDVFAVTGGTNDLIARVNGLAGIGIPSGTFTIASGQIFGSFIGA
jgi:Ca2+-binding RTX toxin-like protein